MTQRRFQFFSWTYLGYTVLVIVWGALVRATGSGAGCGDHWPTCNGEWIPTHPALHTVIELTHRAMSGGALVCAIALWVWSRRCYPKNAVARGAACASLLLVVSEALIGAGLVLLKLVAQDTSFLRAAYLSVHLVNTFLLLGALALTAWAASRPDADWKVLAGPPRFPWLTAVGGTLVLGVTGGIAALGDTLFPEHSLQSGMAHDFSTGAHFLVRLRFLHPALAIVAAAYLIWFSLREGSGAAPRVTRRSSTILLWTVMIQLGIGAWNLSWLAPVFLQLIHLCMADVLWIALILLVLNRRQDGASPPAAAARNVIMSA
jgi:heme a synthase